MEPVPSQILSEKLPVVKNRRSSSAGTSAASAAGNVSDEGIEPATVSSRGRLKKKPVVTAATSEISSPEPVKPTGTPSGTERKFVLRPSVLGDVTSGPPVKEGSFSAGATASDLIVEGKRQWKPTQKMRQVIENDFLVVIQ